jgi:ATP-dependent RNA helicase DDX49/DBP8
MESINSDLQQKTPKFSSLGLDKWLMNNVSYLQYSKPTEIQQTVIPKLLKDEKCNLIGIANTGTGKTASFCLPILDKLAMDPSGIFAIILEPTRELAVQVMEKLKVYSAGFNLRLQMIIGGVDITEQLVKMDQIPHIIVATPGRLAYLLQFSPHQFRFVNNVKYLVLDEFDQLLNSTILPEVNTIISHLPEERQTLFFSATINYNLHNKQFFEKLYKGKVPEIFDFTKGYSGVLGEKGNFKKINQSLENENDAQKLQNNDENENQELSENNEHPESQSNVISYANTEDKKLVKNLIQKYVLIPKITKEHYLVNLLQNDYKKKYTIIFVASCKQCHFLSLLLQLFSVKVSTIHSKMPQRRRFESLEKFKAKINNILVATDIASRGLDIPFVDLVINYDIPRNPDDYIHRVGRTARAGKDGQSVSFVSQYDVDLILAIEEATGRKMEELAVSEDGILENLSLVTKGIKITQMKIYESGFDEKIEKRQNQNKKEKNRREKNNTQKEVQCDE